MPEVMRNPPDEVRFGPGTCLANEKFSARTVPAPPVTSGLVLNQVSGIEKHGPRGRTVSRFLFFCSFFLFLVFFFCWIARSPA